LAEELVFADKQPTKIFRVGLLTGRSTDGKFQINSAKNSFFLILRSLGKLGYLPESAANMQIYLTPVDLCAKAVVAMLDGESQVYHITSPQPHKLSEILPELGFSCLVISDAEFNKLMQKPGRAPAFALLGTVLSATQHAEPVISSQASDAELAAKGFIWPPVDIKISLQSFTSDMGTKETEV
jgi:thioester reductase-like protein